MSIYNISHRYEPVTMHENFSSFGIEDIEYLDDIDPYHERFFYRYCLPFILIGGLLTSPFPLTILVRRRMWLRHEGYFYVTAYLVAHTLNLTALCLSKTVYFFGPRWHIADTSEVICKIWAVGQQVVLSSDWLLVALLSDVYLRGHLLSPAGKYGCRNFAGNYCTLFGARFVTAALYVAALLINWWRVLAAHLFSYGDDPTVCHLTLMWYEDLWLWRFFAHCLTQFIPVVVIIPMLCLAVVVANRSRRQRTASIDDVIDDVIDDNDDAQQLTRLSLAVAGATFLLKYPHFLFEMVIETRRIWFAREVIVAWFATELLMSSQLFIVPLICIGTLRETRAALWSLRLDRFGHRRF